MLDSRETAPAHASRDMYLDPESRAASYSLKGANAAAIPGTPAALAWLAKNMGRLPLSDSLAPAIRLAREGYAVDARYIGMAERHREVLEANAEAAAVFLYRGQPPAPGFVLRQPDLAATLERIAEQGEKGFYEGPVAAEMVRAVKAAGGIWQAADLAGYTVKVREPVVFTYRAAKIASSALPSSGGLVLAIALGILEHLPYAESDAATRMHFVTEALRRAFHLRAQLMGDPDFVHVPVEQLLSRETTAALAADIRADRAIPSAEIESKGLPGQDGEHTTHLSIVDADGNRVAATLTINTFFGSGFVAGGTGVLLNNEMDDFAIGPGMPNIYGLTGGEANAIAPGKRPLSSMSPTFVEDGRGVLILGSPGGSRIISQVLLATLEHVHGETPDAARLVSLPRYHAQYVPDRIEVEEDGFEPAVLESLRNKGHEVVELPRRWGNMQLVWVDRTTGLAVAVSDPRGNR